MNGNGWLTLRRNRGEDIVLTHPDGTQVTVRLLEAGNGWGKISILAPRQVTINRKEVQDKVEAGVTKEPRPCPPSATS